MHYTTSYTNGVMYLPPANRGLATVVDALNDAIYTAEHALNDEATSEADLDMIEATRDGLMAARVALRRARIAQVHARRTQP